jgi:hypothetical protein
MFMYVPSPGFGAKSNINSQTMWQKLKYLGTVVKNLNYMYIHQEIKNDIGGMLV